MIDPTDLPAVLQWLTSAAGVAAWCVMVSDFYRNQKTAEGWFADWFRGLGVVWTQVIVYVTMAILPIVAYLLQLFASPEFIAAAAPHFGAFMMLLLAMLAARGYYEATKHRPDAIEVVPISTEWVTAGEVKEGSPASQPGTEAGAEAVDPAA